MTDRIGWSFFFALFRNMLQNAKSHWLCSAEMQITGEVQTVAVAVGLQLELVQILDVGFQCRPPTVFAAGFTDGPWQSGKGQRAKTCCWCNRGW